MLAKHFGKLPHEVMRLRHWEYVVDLGVMQRGLEMEAEARERDAANENGFSGDFEHGFSGVIMEDDYGDLDGLRSGQRISNSRVQYRTVDGGVGLGCCIPDRFPGAG